MIKTQGIRSSPVQGAYPIKSLYIIKDGLPVFKKEFSRQTEDAENETLVSGFLSAISSFMKDMKNFGLMKELKTSANYKFSFHQVESLLFVVCTESNLPGSLIDKLLNSISMKFLQLYSKQIGSSSMINQKLYTGFDSILSREIISRDLRAPVLRGRQEPSAIKPRLKYSVKSVQNDFYVKGGIPEIVLPHIDGNNSIADIAAATGMEASKIHSFLKYLVKEGIVDLN
ncbi:MAG: hypothetical protein ACTSUE_16400 [Promethearchaeota archaeon]